MSCDVITGDCGFMLQYQDIAREYTNKPVILSALSFLPTLIFGLKDDQKVAILTANSGSLYKMHNMLDKMIVKLFFLFFSFQFGFMERSGGS